jgi:hypothetical protein
MRVGRFRLASEVKRLGQVGPLRKQSGPGWVERGVAGTGGSPCGFGWSGCCGFCSRISIEFQAVARFWDPRARPDCKWILPYIVKFVLS